METLQGNRVTQKNDPIKNLIESFKNPDFTEVLYQVTQKMA